MALLWKMTCNLRHPMDLRHPVREELTWSLMCRSFSAKETQIVGLFCGKWVFNKRSCGCAMYNCVSQHSFSAKSPTIGSSFAKQTHNFKEPTKTSRSHNCVSQNSQKSAMKLVYTMDFVAIWLWRICTKWNCAAAPHLWKVCVRNILHCKLCRELTFEFFVF